MKPAALILAAGYSSRMGTFKPLVRIGGSTAIERAIDLFLSAGMSDVIVVTGYQSEQLEPVVRRKGVRQVFNPRFDEGMFSSIRAGVRALPPEIDACFVLPADIPLVRPLTIERLRQAWDGQPATVVYPVFQKLRGHPPVIRRSVLDEALSSDGAGGLRALLARHAGDAKEVQVIDAAIHLDIDTPEDLARARELARCHAAPSDAECREILNRYHVDPRIVGHSIAVAEVARRLAASLPQPEKTDFAILHAGSLLHDLAKNQPDPACLAAHILEELQFPKVAQVIACHSDLDFSTRRLDEATIVFLADKLVKGDQFVSPEERLLAMAATAQRLEEILANGS